MNEEQQEREPGQTAEREARDRPRIYVASLSDYNAGRLHGAWLAADVEAEALYAGVHAMLAASPDSGAEEWAIHDYEGFGGLPLSDYEALDSVSRVALGIAEHGGAYAALAAHRGLNDEQLSEAFDQAYLGRYTSLADYADQLADDLGWHQELDALPDPLGLYVRFEAEAFARDLEYGGDVFTADAGEGGIHVFDATI
jgi:antirestriction protein